MIRCICCNSILNNNDSTNGRISPSIKCVRVQLKCDGTRWRTGGEVKGKLKNGVGSQYSSHYLGTWCIQHYYRWCTQLGCQQSTELTPPPIWMDSSVSPKDEIWFLRVCHHISTGLYLSAPSAKFKNKCSYAFPLFLSLYAFMVLTGKICLVILLLHFLWQ